MTTPKVNVLPEFHRWIKAEAKRNRRTIQGQVEVMLEMAQKEIENEKSIQSGKTQIDYNSLKKAANE